MADKAVVPPKAFTKPLCKSCSSETIADIKCLKPELLFHIACAIRCKGLKYVGYNKLMFPTCFADSDDMKCMMTMTDFLVKNADDQSPNLLIY